MAKVFVDKGHWHHDSGAVGGVVEATVNNLLGELLMLGCQRQGWATMTNPESDTHVELSERSARANAWGADAFVSCHCNAGGGEGVESLYYPSSRNGLRLADAIFTELAAYNEGPDRKCYADRRGLAVLRETHMPATIVEYLFVDDPEDAAKLKEVAWLRGAAEATVRGLCRYFGTVYVTPEGGVWTPPAEPVKPLPRPPVFGPHWPGVILKHGSRGGDVKMMQRRLIARTWNLGKWGADGVYGDATEKAVRGFQAEKGLTVDGRVGKVTWPALWSTPIT